MSISFSKIAVLAVLSSAVALTTGCATKRATSEVVVAPLGIPGGQVGYNGAVIVDNSAAVITGAENLQAVVYFAFDSSEITAQAASVLNQHVSLLNSNPAAGVVIAGHTDERGSREYNMALGERRAQAARNYLAAQGVAANNIRVISYGEERPAAAGNTEDAYAQNRRAELSY
ncbi:MULTISPECIES: peptidoglycan-associated lipoprotein Pal [Psychrobacter]|jgi:peptidoglycan-associated lipoprotein|uniref:Peptidoglycan-associated lipoprotein n=4 Tax=root TaxID=1 RepID=A0A1G6XVP8_9GAMM|nr:MULTISPECIES: peptidoglycan-associated lipoprotein Pal [Psychrobacter]MEC9444899.1 peptidoglycan-associated lipoprotein Pal [Pseudomonadota bacterium]HBD03370.1 peptidoglycan-associated lipoprotein Pal [Psychrobacter sp.]MBZ1392609.1 peptidoglycan-associated lipoprotein Pal [Psychrobacter pacificensis]MCG3880170.1 peptidoglycan-associated lipoprotein Pal [Psychrobacter sp. Ps6]MDE0844798.1 peptidoglycan-associated lipoprotein Pal [Psychrobacter pacificensis]|tara:strand:+ start:70 stop:588 length:519 start_codon:yes stop_codon:yes gene_type:complete